MTSPSLAPPPDHGTPTLEVTLTPAELNALRQRDLDQTVCVVFDVLRATTTMLAALAQGAERIIPAGEIAEALALRQRQPELLLAGERQGVRIRAELTGGVDFDLGNSPREFTADRVRGRHLVMTTTNGTQALQACAHAQTVLIGALANLSALARNLERQPPPRLVLVCSGTLDQAAFEDTLAAGALCDRLWSRYSPDQVADAARIARVAYRAHAHDLAGALANTRNGRRLLRQPDLRGDVAFCATVDRFDFVAGRATDGSIVRLPESASGWTG